MRTFTFGFDHTHPITGEPLARHYIQVPGEDDLSRRFMLAVFGRNWAMQYKDPSKLKYLDRMTELKWTNELLALISEADRDLFESVVGERLEVHFELEARTKPSAEIDAYFDTVKGLPPVETHTGTPVTEYGLVMSGRGTKQVFYTDDEIEAIYPLAKQIRHTVQYGGKVMRRRVLVIEDWVEVTNGEIDEMCKPYDKVDLEAATKAKGTILP